MSGAAAAAVRAGFVDDLLRGDADLSRMAERVPTPRIGTPEDGSVTYG